MESDIINPTSEESIVDFNNMAVLSTGGYNNQFLQSFANSFNVKIFKVHDYLKTVIWAIDFFNKHTNDCFYSLPYESLENIYLLKKKKVVEGEEVKEMPTRKHKKQVFYSQKKDLYPYLLVNIRSGANFIRVEGPGEYKRVSGTAIGAATFVGTMRMMYDVEDPTELLKASETGDSSKIDMSVGDIYGEKQSLESLGLPSDIIASSFGKLKDMDADELKDVKMTDVSRSMATMIVFNTITLANLVAQKENLNRCVIIGWHTELPSLEMIS